MGLKRITLYAEIVYPQDDTRSVDELKNYSVQALTAGAALENGRLASAAIVGASQDPDPEPVADDVVPVMQNPEAP